MSPTAMRRVCLLACAIIASITAIATAAAAAPALAAAATAALSSAAAPSALPPPPLLRPPPRGVTGLTSTTAGDGFCVLRSLWFHAGSFYALAPPSSLPDLEVCLKGAALLIYALPSASDPLTAGALAKPAWVGAPTRVVAAPLGYEPPPLTRLVRAGQWVTAMLESSVEGGKLSPASVLLIAGADRAPAVRDGAAGAAALTLGGGAADDGGEATALPPLHALFDDDLAAIAGGGWVGFEEVLLPTGGEGGGPGAKRMVERAGTASSYTCVAKLGQPPRPPLLPPSMIFFNPPTGRLGDAGAIASALASAADAAGLAFRVVDGEAAIRMGGGGGGTPPPTLLSSLAASLATARLIVGRGGADLAAVAAAAPAGSSLLELTPVEGHPAVAAVVAARATAGPASSLSSHALWTPHPPGGPVGAHLAWADPGEGRRYGAWARPDCRVGALHGAECASAAARAALVVGGRCDGGEDSGAAAAASLASMVDAALRGVYEAEARAGVGLA